MSTDLSNYPPIFVELKKEITYYETLLEKVTKFKVMIQNNASNGLFDDQDIGWIDDDIKTLTAELNKRVEEFESRKNFYENSIVRFEDILDQRKNIIESADAECQVLSNRPELLEKFAQFVN